MRSGEALLASTLTGRVLDQMADAPVADLEHAEALIGEVLAVSPHDPIAHLAKALMLQAQNRLDGAIAELEIAVALNRNWVNAIAQLGQCKFLAGAIEEAIPAQEQAIRLSPRDPIIPNWYWRIGMAHLLKSRIDEAIEWLQKAERANPLLAGPCAWLAAASALVGDTERAAAELAEARRLSGDDRYSSIARFKRAWHLGGRRERSPRRHFSPAYARPGCRRSDRHPQGHWTRHVRRSCALSSLTNSAAHSRASSIFAASRKARAFARA